MKRSRLISLGILLGLVIWLFLAFDQKDKKREASQVVTPLPPSASPATQATLPAIGLTPTRLPSREDVELVQSIYSAPIAFYGKVQDQHGQPVAGAAVDYAILDRFFEPGLKKSGVADERGYFFLTGVQGAAVTVGVSKTGYDPIYKQSNGAFSFGVPYDAQRDRPTPTKDNPAVFVLRKKAPAEPLFTIPHRDVIVPKDGTPVEVSLKTGRIVSVGQGDVKIECWTFDQVKEARGRYEWYYHLSVPGGGLVRRTEAELDQEAPETGYELSIEFRMPTSAERWQEDHDQLYWVKLRDGTYARMRLRMTTGGGHFASITSYLNPSGSRNLEYDPGKQASAR